MNCKECGNDIMLSIEPQGWKKIIRLLPLANYRCVRCGHTALHFTASGYRSSAFKILFATLVLASLGAAIWYSSQYYRKPAEPDQAANVPVERRQVEPPSSAVAKSPNESAPAMADKSDVMEEQAPESSPPQPEEIPKQTVAEVVEQDLAEKPAIPEKSPPAQKEATSLELAKSHAIPEAGPPITLESVKIKAEGLGIVVSLRAGSPVEDFSQFPLDSPPRQVIDLPGNWTYDGPQSFAIGAKGMDRLRVGVHPDKLRLVIDLSGKKPAGPTIKTAPYGLKIFMR